MDVRAFGSWTSTQRKIYPAFRAMGWNVLGRDVRPDICPDVCGISRPKTLYLGCFSFLNYHLRQNFGIPAAIYRSAQMVKQCSASKRFVRPWCQEHEEFHLVFWQWHPVRIPRPLMVWRSMVPNREGGARAGKYPKSVFLKISFGVFLECFWASSSECPKKCSEPGAQKHSEDSSPPPGGLSKSSPFTRICQKGNNDNVCLHLCQKGLEVCYCLWGHNHPDPRLGLILGHPGPHPRSEGVPFRFAAMCFVLQRFGPVQVPRAGAIPAPIQVPSWSWAFFPGSGLDGPKQTSWPLPTRCHI